MTPKLLRAVFLPALAGMTLARAQTESFAPAPSGPTFSVTMAPTIVSQYVFRGLRYGGPALQPWIEADAGSWAAGIWSSTPLSGGVSGQSDPEVDPYVSFKQACGAGITITPSFQAYTYPRAPLNQGFNRSTYEPSLAVSANVHGVQLTPKASYDFTLGATTLELSAALALPLRTLGTELDFTANAGTTLLTAAMNTHGKELPPGRAWGDYWLTGFSLPFQMGTGTKISVGYAYSRGFDAWTKSGNLPKRLNPLAAGRGVLTASAFFTF